MKYLFAIYPETEPEENRCIEWTSDDAAMLFRLQHTGQLYTLDGSLPFPLSKLEQILNCYGIVILSNADEPDTEYVYDKNEIDNTLIFRKRHSA
ncbi:hypothetical protein [Terasakiella sp. SH-1]|uniref:hypothetical protein n=1 Tax=Terasakiella sp. SH-1 TaxID=2560057 RepID=UPI0010738706|nr:hypothetical protein [Terasakiella sp. SH-1]